MSKKYTLVTGGAGYIGAHMAGMLIEAGHNVVIFDNLSTGVRPWLAKGAKFVKGDLLTDGAIGEVFKEIFHVSAGDPFRGQNRCSGVCSSTGTVLSQ